MNQTLLSSTVPLPIVPEIFRGTPSQVVNLWRYVRGALVIIGIAALYLVLAPRWGLSAAWLLFPVLAVAIVLLYRYLQVALTLIIVDEERITVREGVLNRKTLTLELFRIQNTNAIQPWWQRPFGVGTVFVEASDTLHPRLWLYGLYAPDGLRDQLNRAAILLRDRKGVREVNMGRV